MGAGRQKRFLIKLGGIIIGKLILLVHLVSVASLLLPRFIRTLTFSEERGEPQKRGITLIALRRP